MAWTQSDAAVALGVLIVAGVAAVTISVWRISQSDPRQRVRGYVSLLFMGLSVVAILTVFFSLQRLAQSTGSGSGGTPSQSAPVGPDFATPAGGGSLP